MALANRLRLLRRFAPRNDREGDDVRAPRNDRGVDGRAADDRTTESRVDDSPTAESRTTDDRRSEVDGHNHTAVLNREQVRRLLESTTPEETAELFRRAADLKERTVGREIYLRGIVEFSNICRKDCSYCGIRKSNAGVDRFLMEEEEIVDAARRAYRRGFGSVVLQSGERADPEFAGMVERLVRRLKSETEGGIGITLSLGEQDHDTYRRWFEAGAHRYLLRIETSSPELYRRYHPADHDHGARRRCLEDLRRIGYQVGSGMLIGLPGQTADDLAGDALFLKEIDVDMIGMGPYIPHRDTPLAGRVRDFNPARQLELGLKMIAACRLLMPEINIAAATSLQTLSPDGWRRGVRAGANVVMPNFTPARYRGAYSLYEGKPDGDVATDSIPALEKLFAGLPEKVVPDRWGDSPHFFKRTGLKID